MASKSNLYDSYDVPCDHDRHCLKYDLYCGFPDGKAQRKMLKKKIPRHVS